MMALGGACLLGSAAMAQTVASAYFDQGVLRVLILSGRNNHDWRTTTPFLARILDQTGLFDERITEEPAGLNATALTPYDVLVVDYNGPRWGETAEAAVAGFVKSGKRVSGGPRLELFVWGNEPLVTATSGRAFRSRRGVNSGR